MDIEADRDTTRFRQGSTRSRIDVVFEILLTALLTFSPFAYGAALPWAEEVVLSLVGLMAILFTLCLVFQPNNTAVWSWSNLPILLFLLLACFQYIPIAAGWVSWLSPHTVSMRMELLDGSASANGWPSLSFYPLASWHGLKLLCAVSTVFVIVSNTYRRSAQIRRLLTSITVIGVAVAAMALYQNLSADHTVYGWLGAMPAAHPNSGPFMNHSHFGQFMNLSIGAAIALLMIRRDDRREKGATRNGSPKGMLFGPGSLITWLLLGFVLVAALTICLSLTRGGIFSLLVAGVLTAAWFFMKRGGKGQSRGTLYWGLLLLLLLIPLYLAFDSIYERLAASRQAQHDVASRWEIIRDLADAWKTFPLFGTGLGTHEVVFPMFDKGMQAIDFTHAENEFAQLIEETGFIGLALCLTFILCICKQYIQLTASRGDSDSVRAAAYGLGFGILAILIHSLSDFGQHVPAIAFLTATHTGLLVALGQRTPRRQARSKSNTTERPISSRSALLGRGRLWIRWGAVAAVVGITTCCVYSADLARRGEEHFQQASGLEQALARTGWEDGTNDDYINLIQQATAAIQLQPENALYAYSLSYYRWRSISRVTDPQTGEVVMTADSIDFARQIAGDLKKSLTLCPTYGRPYALAGQIQYFVLSDPEGIQQIRVGYRLAPNDPNVCLAVGAVDADQDNWSAAQNELRRATILDSALFPKVVDLLLKRHDQPEIAFSLAAGNTSSLQTLCSTFEAKGRVDLATRARSESESLIRSAAERADASPRELEREAERYEAEQKIEIAIVYRRRALAIDYGNVDSRVKLARLLQKLHRTDEAMREARICSRIRPNSARSEN